jgi:hypothetical protein
MCDSGIMFTSEATKWAPDVHWAEIHALQKLLAQRPEKFKIRHKIDFWKNEPAPDGVEMYELSNGKYLEISWDYDFNIFLQNVT